MNVSRSNSLIYISILRITISMGFPLSFGHFLSIEDNFSCFLCREQLHQAMHMMFDEGVAGSFCGNNGSRRTDCRYERYHAGICRSITESKKADAIRFFSEGIRKPAGMILTENLLVDGFRSLCRSLIHVRRMECAKRKLTGFLCLIHIILHIWDRFGQSLGVAANSVFRSRRSLRAPAWRAAAAGIRMLPHHLVRIPFPALCAR